MRKISWVEIEIYQHKINKTNLGKWEERYENFSISEKQMNVSSLN